MQRPGSAMKCASRYHASRHVKTDPMRSDTFCISSHNMMVFRRVHGGTSHPTQAGSGKTHLLRSAQVQKIWRGAIRGGVQSGRSLGDEEREGSDDREGGRRLERREETPVIITVCRNVHANTPYFIWKSILLNIFSFGHEASRSLSCQPW